MEEKIVYFEKPGKENTGEVIKLVLERAKLRNINRIVLASSRGYTAKSFLDAVEGKDINLVVVPWQFNLKKEVEGSPFPQELVKELLEKKHIVQFGTMPLSSNSSNDLYGTNIRKALGNILRVLGQGMKVCVEITMMACDGGCIKMGEKVIVVAGTDAGADFAVVATAASSTNVTSLRINEIICKPIL
ncbi:hypothetical protein ES708_29862 [subsurface metagenome]